MAKYLTERGSKRFQELISSKSDRVTLFDEDFVPVPLPLVGRTYESISFGQLGDFLLQENKPNAFIESAQVKQAYALADFNENELAKIEYFQGPKSGGYWAATPVIKNEQSCICELVDWLVFEGAIRQVIADSIKLSCGCPGDPTDPPPAGTSCPLIKGGIMPFVVPCTVQGVQEEVQLLGQPWSAELPAMINGITVDLEPFASNDACNRQQFENYALSQTYFYLSAPASSIQVEYSMGLPTVEGFHLEVIVRPGNGLTDGDFVPHPGFPSDVNSGMFDQSPINIGPEVDISSPINLESTNRESDALDWSTASATLF